MAECLRKHTITELNKSTEDKEHFFQIFSLILNLIALNGSELPLVKNELASILACFAANRGTKM